MRIVYYTRRMEVTVMLEVESEDDAIDQMWDADFEDLVQLAQDQSKRGEPIVGIRQHVSPVEGHGYD